MDIATNLRTRAAAKCDGVASLAPFRQIVERILDVHEAVRANHAAVAIDDKITALGRRQAVRQHVAEDGRSGIVPFPQVSRNAAGQAGRTTGEASAPGAGQD